MRRLAHVALAVFAASCTSTPADPAVRDVVVRYYERLSDRDWPGLEAMFWPDATLSTVWQPPSESSPRVVVTDIAGFIAAAPQGPGSRSVFEERPLSIEVRVGVGLATVWVRYAARFGDPGDVACWTGTDAITLLRHEGAWRIVSIAYANDGSAGPATPDRCA